MSTFWKIVFQNKIFFLKDKVTKFITNIENEKQILIHPLKSWFLVLKIVNNDFLDFNWFKFDNPRNDTPNWHSAYEYESPFKIVSHKFTYK